MGGWITLETEVERDAGADSWAHCSSGGTGTALPGCLIDSSHRDSICTPGLYAIPLVPPFMGNTLPHSERILSSPKTKSGGWACREEVRV